MNCPQFMRSHIVAKNDFGNKKFPLALMAGNKKNSYI